MEAEQLAQLMTVSHNSGPWQCLRALPGQGNKQVESNQRVGRQIRETLGMVDDCEESELRSLPTEVDTSALFWVSRGRRAPASPSSFMEAYGLF